MGMACRTFLTAYRIRPTTVMGEVAPVRMEEDRLVLVAAVPRGSSTAERTGAGGNATNKASGYQSRRSLGSNRGCPFILHPGSHPDDEGPEPDGLNETMRMQIEASVIDKFIDSEPVPQRTGEGNNGFDLSEADGAGNVVR